MLDQALCAGEYSRILIERQRQKHPGQDNRHRTERMHFQIVSNSGTALVAHHQTSTAMVDPIHYSRRLNDQCTGMPTQVVEPSVSWAATPHGFDTRRNTVRAGF